MEDELLAQSVYEDKKRKRGFAQEDVKDTKKQRKSRPATGYLLFSMSQRLEVILCFVREKLRAWDTEITHTVAVLSPHPLTCAD